MLSWYTQHTDQLNDAISEFAFQLIFFTDDGRSFTLYTDDAYELLSPSYLWMTGSNEQERIPALHYAAEDFYDDPTAILTQLCGFFCGKGQSNITLFLEGRDLAIEFDAKKGSISVVTPVETLLECHEQDLISSPIDCWDELIDILLGSG